MTVDGGLSHVFTPSLLETMMRPHTLPACLLCLLAVGVHAATLHVSTTGHDQQPGTAAAPLATLQQALAKARDLHAANPTEKVTILLEPGRYPLLKPISLVHADSNLDIIAREPGKTRLSGSTDIPASAFKTVDDPAILKLLDPSAASQVRVADLTLLGIPPQPPIIPRRWPNVTVLPEVFFNDQRMTLARWPDHDWTTISKIVDPGSKMNDGTVVSAQKGPDGKPGKPVAGTFAFEEDRPLRWDVSRNFFVRGYWCFDWAEDCVSVAKLDKQAKTITMGSQHTFGLRQGNPSPRRWYAFNLLEELTQPGEFYLDHKTNKLYLIPPANLEQATIRLTLNRSEIFKLDQAHHVTFRHLILEEAGAGFKATNCNNLAIEACTVRNMHHTGISVHDGKNARIIACDVHHTGTGGISLSGGNFKELIPTNHLVENCHIHHFSIHKLTYSNGISLYGIKNVARHNLISHAPHMAVGMSGNDGLFEYNIVHDVCLAADDSGALYKGRNPARRGNVIRYNLWHSIGKPMGHGVAAIYFDDGDVGETVFGNIFFRCGDPGRGSFGTVFSHGGHDITAENNVFIECKRPLGSAPWNFARWQAMIKSSLWQTRLLKEVNITQPPYTTRYLDFKDFMNPTPEQKRVSHARRNLLLYCADTISGNWQFDSSNLVTDTDPGFVDLNAGNFNFKPDAPIFKLIPGFQPIPCDKIGLYASPLRPVVPQKAWNLPPAKPLPKLPKRAKSAPGTPSKRGAAPVYQVVRATTAPSIDGQLAANEWQQAKPVKLEWNYDANRIPTALAPQASLLRDDQALYVSVAIPVSDKAKLNTNAWGGSHAVEIAIQPNPTTNYSQRPPAKTPVYVFRGYANSFFFCGTSADGVASPLNQEPAPARFAATRPNPQSWTAEFALPFVKFGLTSDKLEQCAINITVRNPDHDLWSMWLPTHGHSTFAHNAARIRW